MNPADKNFDRFRLNVILAATFLGLAGLVWSLDAFFVYLSLGISLVFFFIAVRLQPDPRSTQQHYGPMGQRSSGGAIGRASPAGDTKKRVIAWVKAAVFLLLGYFFLNLLFGDSQETYSDFYATAERYHYAGSYDSARLYYARALNEFPSAEAFNGYGNTWLEQEAYDSAIYYYDRAIAEDETYVIAHYNKGVANFRQKRFAESIASTRKAVSIDPSYIDGYLLMGDSFYETKRYDSALHHYEKAYDNGSRGPWISHVMAYLYDTRGNREKAILFYKEAVRYDSTKTDVCARLGELLPGKEGEIYRDLGRSITSE